MFQATIRSIDIMLVGIRPLYDPDVLRPVLDVFQRFPLLTPDSWRQTVSFKTSYDPYSPDALDELLACVCGVPSIYWLDLKRAKRMKHYTTVNLDKRPGLRVKLARTTNPKDWGVFFAFADQLAAAYQPDYGWVHIKWQVAPPYNNELEAAYDLLYRGLYGFEGYAYANKGPGGLGMRTYFGPRYIEQFGADLLRSTPAVVSETDWGGYCIDLVPEPWTADWPELIAPWQQSMAHLAPAEIFAIFPQGEPGVHYAPKPNRRALSHRIKE